MNERQIANIRAFINERDMSQDVRDLIFRNFLEKKNGADVHMLAAQTLAVQLLTDAWSEMERHKKKQQNEKSLINPGL